MEFCDSLKVKVLSKTFTFRANLDKEIIWFRNKYIKKEGEKEIILELTPTNHVIKYATLSYLSGMCCSLQIGTAGGTFNIDFDSYSNLEKFSLNLEDFFQENLIEFGEGVSSNSEYFLIRNKLLSIIKTLERKGISSFYKNLSLPEKDFYYLIIGELFIFEFVIPSYFDKIILNLRRLNYYSGVSTIIGSQITRGNLEFLSEKLCEIEEIIISHANEMLLNQELNSIENVEEVLFAHDEKEYSLLKSENLLSIILKSILKENTLLLIRKLSF